MKTINNELFSQHSCNLKFLAKEGFNTPKYYELDTYDDFENIIIDNLNTHLDLGIDGFVQEVEEYNDLDGQKILFRYNSTTVSKLIRIDWIPNPSGEILPVAIFEDVDLCGKKYNSCSMKNVAYLEKLITKSNMMIGDDVHIALRDTNIPMIIGVDSNNNIEPIAVPKICENCNTRLSVVNHKFVCENTNCSNKALELLVRFFDVIEVQIEQNILKYLVEELNIRTLSDLKSISKNQLKQFKSADTIINAINTKKIITKEQLINISAHKNNSIAVVGHFITNTELSILLDTSTTAEDIIDVELIDEDSREALVIAINKQLQLLRLNAELFNISESNSNKLNGYSFCLTNTMKLESMKYYEQLIIDNGGVIRPVSMKLNFLVTNEVGNTKYKKVVESNTKLYNSGKTHSINIIDENSLLKMMEK